MTQEIREPLRTNGPRPEYSRKYACQGDGGSLRPIPIGKTKQEAFCSVCQVETCPINDMPVRLKRLGLTMTKYPPIPVWATMNFDRVRAAQKRAEKKETVIEITDGEE